jgi:signal transduction histidine kinase/ligand-binding sensor domain-containing protein
MVLQINYTYSQQNIFHRVPERPNKSIATFTGIAQDKQGYIWLSSYLGGLHRFDGSGYTSFMNDPLNPNSIGSNYSECLMIDAADIVWIGIYGGGLDRYDKTTNTFSHFRHDAKNGASIINDTVTSIIQDHAGNIWIGTYGGLDLFSEKNNSFTHYYNIPGDSASLSYNHIRVVYEDNQGTLWVGCGSPFSNDTNEDPSDGGLNSLNKKTGKFTRYLHNDANPNSIENNKVSAIFEDSRGNFWVGTKGNGLHTLNRKSGIFTHYYYDAKHPENLSRPPVNPTSQSDHVRFIKEDASGAIWIGSWNGGLNKYNPATKTITHFGNLFRDGNVVLKDTSSGFTEYAPWQALSSNDSSFWISSYSYPNSGNLYFQNPFKPNIPYYADKWTTGFAQENDSILYISSYGAGITRKNIKTGEESVLVNNPKDPLSLSNDYVYSIIADDKSNLWIATYYGLNKYDKLDKSFKKYQHDDENKTSIISNGISCLFIDNTKNLWIGTDSGLDKMMEEGKFFHYVHDTKDSTSIGYGQIYCITQGENNELWVGSQSGLNRFDIRTGKCAHYLSPLVTISIFKDSYGIIWAGTHQGLYRFEKETNQFIRFIEPNSQTVINGVVNIQEDKGNNLWVHTLDAFTRINAKRNMLKVFSENYGIKVITPALAGSLLSSDGKLYFGDDHGYYFFYPDSLDENTQPKLYFTGLKINDAEVFPGPGGIIKHPLWQETEIKLNYSQNNFSFEFSAIHYKSPGEEKYLYMLENYEKEWHNTGKEPKAYFFNVPAGSYLLKIRAVNPDGQWSEKQMAIFISPPWYKTWWAYTMFALAFIGLIWGFIYYRSLALRRENRILEEKVSHRTNLLNQSLENLKSTQAQLIQSEKMASLGELTAGIAHEIQNPLNFVNNFSEVNGELVDELKAQLATGNLQLATEIADDLKDNETKILHHGKRADAIVKGMLQHSRKSTGQKEPTDINALADEYLRLSYHGMRAKDKSFNAEIKTDFDTSIGKIDVVPQDIGRALLNLYNNAFYAVSERSKNTEGFQNPRGLHPYVPTVTVVTKKSDDEILISVKDNGPGIPQNIVDKIFQPFFTTKPTGDGTGLGLSLSYDIIKAHGGEIEVKTKQVMGSVFMIKLAIT